MNEHSVVILFLVCILIGTVIGWVIGGKSAAFIGGDSGAVLAVIIFFILVFVG